jgi:hypothetical protein
LRSGKVREHNFKKDPRFVLQSGKAKKSVIFVLKQKILVINEAKQGEILLKLKVYDGEKLLIEYCELSLKYWTKFAQVSAIFYGMNES